MSNHAIAIRQTAWKRGIYFVAVCLTLFVVRDLKAQGPTEQLTIKRIYSQPNLSGRPYKAVQWSPDGKLVSFIETRGQGKEAKTELWAMDVGTTQRRLLVTAEKLEVVLPPDKTQLTQATGLGRRAASQYSWAPDGNSILFVGAKSL